MWDFGTPPELQHRLDWALEFVRSEIEPIDVLVGEDPDRLARFLRSVMPRLQQQVREHGLWAWHLRPEDGGMGSTQVAFALLNEIVGRSLLAPRVFGAPGTDSGNMEILAKYGTPLQREKYLAPLAAGEVTSSFAATEPTGGADPQTYTTTAALEGDEWVLNGEKWFASNADRAAFLITMAVTDPLAPPRERLSMFVVDGTNPGVELIRNVHVPMHGAGRHAYLRYNNVRVPAGNLIGEPGGAFRVMQARMGPARIHMAMRATGMMLRAYEMMCERAKSRVTQGEPLADKQLIQAMIADSWVEIEQYRLLVLRTAWKLDQAASFKETRADISALKAVMPGALERIVRRAIQIHGSLGLTSELPLMTMLSSALVRGIGDGPTEVHKLALARRLLRDVKPHDGLFPSYHVPALAEYARAKYPEIVHPDDRATTDTASTASKETSS
jgi:acyl-CoA dehydrogenase